MNFTSLEFLLFFPVVLALHWALPHRLRWVLLLAASYLFYMNWNPWLVLLLLFTTLTSWLAGRGIANAKGKGARRGWLALGVGVPLGALALFKYADFFLQSGGALLGRLGLPGMMPALNLLLPVGISFYTFQTLSYVLDIYHGKCESEPHLGYYALFVSFFPQLVAGPIERPEHLLPQLKGVRHWNSDLSKQGLWQLLRGFFKKLALADALALLADPVFSAPEASVGPAVALATMCFALQIYCDFSGYSDIARGTAALMGIRLTENFRKPYHAQTIRDFWRRWHISLTGWFTDYLYKPLGGSRQGRGKTARNVMLVFLLSGLWHGADWTFVVWGGIHGVYLVLGRLFGRAIPQAQSSVSILLRRVRTFLLTCLPWLFFRASSMSDALSLLARLPEGWNRVGFNAMIGQMSLSWESVLPCLLALLCLLLLERLPEDYPNHTNTERTALQGALLLLCIAFAWLLLLSGSGESAFLYFQF